jgi:hypothetical protein
MARIAVIEDEEVIRSMPACAELIDAVLSRRGTLHHRGQVARKIGPSCCG